MDNSYLVPLTPDGGGEGEVGVGRVGLGVEREGPEVGREGPGVEREGPRGGKGQHGMDCYSTRLV